MTRVEDALALAREAAAERRAEGAYWDAEATPEGPPRAEQTIRRLSEWAILEPDISDVRSIRRWGKPITLLKRGLLRLLAQYHGRAWADQTRYNLLLLSYVEILEARILEMEKRLTFYSPYRAPEKAPPRPRSWEESR